MINIQNSSFLKNYPMDSYNADTLCKRFTVTFYHEHGRDVDFRFYRKFNNLTIYLNRFIYFSKKSLKNNK